MPRWVYTQVDRENYVVKVLSRVPPKRRHLNTPSIVAIPALENLFGADFEWDVSKFACAGGVHGFQGLQSSGNPKP